MIFPDYGEGIQYVRVRITSLQEDILFSLSDFEENFDVSLGKHFEEHNSSQILLMNLENSFDGIELLLGTITSESRENRQLELQYEIKSKSDLLSSGSMTLDYTPIPDKYELGQAYPNPFNPRTTIEYALPIDSELILAVYDIQGRMVTNLSKGFMSAGYYEATWDASQYSSSIYFIRLQAYDMEAKNSFESIQKIMLVK